MRFRRKSIFQGGKSQKIPLKMPLTGRGKNFDSPLDIGLGLWWMIRVSEIAVILPAICFTRYGRFPQMAVPYKESEEESQNEEIWYAH